MFFKYTSVCTPSVTVVGASSEPTRYTAVSMSTTLFVEAAVGVHVKSPPCVSSLPTLPLTAMLVIVEASPSEPAHAPPSPLAVLLVTRPLAV